MAKPLHFEKYGQLCILSIDDDQVNLMVMEQLLTPEGWKIISAGDGEEAYDALNEDAWPDFVFLDYTMNSGDSGEEICRKLRAAFGAVPIPIVMCTALTAGHTALDECMKVGATDYLLKPYERNKMIEKVQQYCGDKSKKAPAAPAAAAAAPAAAAAAQVASHPAGGSAVEDFCKNLDLEYCGKKLSEKGISMEDLRGMDDTGLRKAGIVVKSQRDKILEGLRA